MEMAVGVVVSDVRASWRVYDKYARLLWLSVVSLSVLLAMCVESVSGQGECSTTFQVWQPNQDVLRQLEHVQLSVQNLTSYCRAQAATTEVRVQSHVSNIQNTTMRLERDLMALQVSRMDGQLTSTKMSAEVNNMKRELDNTNRRVDNLELDLYMLRTRIKDTGPRFERAHMTTDMASLLKNSVGDLKAEWLLMKREIEGLKRDSRRISRQQDSMTNSTNYIHNDVKSMTSGLNMLEKRALRSEEHLRLLESRLSKTLADMEELKNSVLDLTTQTEDHRGDISTLQAGNIRLEKQLHDLQVATNRLRDGQIMPRTSGSRGRALPGRAENSPGIVLQQSAGEDFIARDCHELYQTGHRLSGVYHIQPKGVPYLTTVYCLMLNRTGHTIIQRRIDGLLNFNRRWLEYEHGFGNPYGEHWLGNKLLHSITNQKQYLLRIDLEDWEGKRYYAEYTQFTVAPASDNYRLRVSGYTGDAGDSLSYHDNTAFSTEDVDNDLHTRHCAAENQGGWWFHSCFSSNLNGVYHRAWYSQVTSNYADGVVWYTIKDSEFYSLKNVQMMLKPKTP